jgi:hypothetical protein
MKTSSKFIYSHQNVTKFRLKKEYITDVADNKEVSVYIPSTGKTLQGTSYGTIDHPKFTDLRNKLEDEGYIQVERSWWNGDRVLKPFYLNGIGFNKGETFPCAAAMNVKMKVAKKK